MQTIAKIKEQFKNGGAILLLDDLLSTPTCYLLASAAGVNAESVSKLVNLARGVIMAPCRDSHLKRLGLAPMSGRAETAGLDFSVSVEARSGVSTGISAADRATTLRCLALSQEFRRDLVSPGHIFPLRAKDGGVLVRSGIAEAAVDILSLCEQAAVGALIQCLNSKGENAEPSEIQALAERENLPQIKLSEIIQLRLQAEPIVELFAEAKLPSKYGGEFRSFCFRSKIDGAEHFALLKGDLALKDEQGKQLAVLARVQAEDPLGDLLAFSESKGLANLRAALNVIGAENRGVFVYVRHSRSGNVSERAQRLLQGPGKKGALSREAELREFGIGAQILSQLGAKRIRLLSNSQRGMSGLAAFNIEVVGVQNYSLENS